MNSIVVDELSDRAFGEIERRARSKNRSVNQEARQILENATEGSSVQREDVEQLIERLRRNRARMRAKMDGPPMTIEDIQRAIDEGRP